MTRNDPSTLIGLFLSLFKAYDTTTSQNHARIARMFLLHGNSPSNVPTTSPLAFNIGHPDIPQPWVISSSITKKSLHFFEHFLKKFKICKMAAETNGTRNSPGPTRILNAQMSNYETGFANLRTILSKIYDVAFNKVRGRKNF